jgi:hypothetical protein
MEAVYLHIKVIKTEKGKEKKKKARLDKRERERKREQERMVREDELRVKSKDVQNELLLLQIFGCTQTSQEL